MFVVFCLRLAIRLPSSFALHSLIGSNRFIKQQNLIPRHSPYLNSNEIRFYDSLTINHVALGHIESH